MPNNQLCITNQHLIEQGLKFIESFTPKSESNYAE